MTYLARKLSKTILFAVLPLAVLATTGYASAITYGAGTTYNGNPIGGGAGYTNIISPTDPNVFAVVSTKADFLAKLPITPSGKILYVADSAEINLTDQRNLIIPAGVTLASGRGRNGSQGARIYSTAIPTRGCGDCDYYILFKTGGNGVRFTGIRLDGTHIGWAQYPAASENLTMGILLTFST